MTRSEEIAVIMLRNNFTIRATAATLGMSKSYVHKCLTKELPHINRTLASQVEELIEKNTAERHIRGGLATREYWRNKQ